MRAITISKVGGSLIDFDGDNIPLIIQRVRELRQKDEQGPILVVSAPKGVTDYLIETGGKAARAQEFKLDFPFNEYRRLAERFVKPQFLQELYKEIDEYKDEVEKTLNIVTKRFENREKAVVLTSGGELPTASLFDYILNSHEIESTHIEKDKWHIITDDNYEDADPDYEESKNNLKYLTEAIEEGKTVCFAGFLGRTSDGLETMLGRGGSDLSAVFTAALLNEKYTAKPLLYKDNPLQTTDPSIVKGQKLKPVKLLTYNEAIKASSTGMKIIQSSAVRFAKNHKLSIGIMPLTDPAQSTIIRADDPGEDIIKCITGAKNCAVITINNDRSKSLEDCMRLWEGFDNFLDLGTEILDNNKVIRDYLILEGQFVKQHEEQIRAFDNELEIQYGVGVVTLIGDKMKDQPGIASIAIGSIPHLNIKRAVFHHTSQITLALKEEDVNEAIATIYKSLTRALPF